MNKSELRSIMRVRRDSIDQEYRRDASGLICEALLRTPEYRDCCGILIYVSFGSEVATDGIIKNALTSGKDVFCPVTEKFSYSVNDTGRKRRDGGLMDFYRMNSVDDLVTGNFGIKEPAAIEENKFTEAMTSANEYLMVMPGVAFDRSRNRIGYSGGFYDRYLGEHFFIKPLVTCALAFNAQLTDDTITADSHDHRPDFIITEKEIIR